MQFKFPFVIHGSDKIPMLEVRLTNKENDKATNYVCMLDSGAFMNVFHSDIAEILDIDLSKIKETILFGGVKDSKKQMKGKPYIIKMTVMQKGKNYSFDSYIVFSDEITDTGYPLLGRIGFFDRFDEVCFNYKNDKFYLQKD